MTQMIKPVAKKPVAKKPTIKSARIAFVLDRSGSMDAIKVETIGGYNAFIDGQRALPGKTSVSLYQFDNEYLALYEDLDIKKVKPLDTTMFVPRGMTALYDAIGYTINKLKGKPSPKSSKTIIAILTDGDENASQEYKCHDIAKLIKEVQDEMGWEVLFIGANMNALQVGSIYGIKASNIAMFSATGKGSWDALNTISSTTAMYRGAKMKSASGVKFDNTTMTTQSVYDSYTANDKLEIDTDEDNK